MRERIRHENGYRETMNGRRKRRRQGRNLRRSKARKMRKVEKEKR